MEPAFEFSYLFLSLVAGLLTVLAPCVLPLLPVIIGSSATKKNLKKPLVIILSLSVSIITFTLLLKASTSLLGVPDNVWKWLSGGILLVFGVVTLFPDLWERVSQSIRLGSSSNKRLARAMKKDGYGGDILVGASLGPVFSSCSPTYLAISTTILPASYATGMVYLMVYVLGLAVPLILISFYGQKLASKLGALSNPRGWFKRIVAVLFIIVGVAIITGYDKKFEAWLISQGLYDGIVQIESNLTPEMDLQLEENR